MNERDGYLRKRAAPNPDRPRSHPCHTWRQQVTSLPPNPYTLGPIKRRDRLAGRSGELKELEYYLRLAEAGQSPHLALIGQRGVGKTSLLLAASQLAQDHSLLPVAIDLNESKVRSAGVFWHDLYSTLTLAAAEAGCWGGMTGAIYSSLLGQLYQRKSIDLVKDSVRYRVADCAHAHPVFYGFARLADGKVIAVSVLKG